MTKLLLKKSVDDFVLCIMSFNTLVSYGVYQDISRKIKSKSEKTALCKGKKHEIPKVSTPQNSIKIMRWLRKVVPSLLQK